MQSSDTDKEGEELFVVASTDTGAEPFAMMVKLMNTVSTEVAVEGTLWSEDETGVTVLKSRHMCTMGTHDQLMDSGALLLASG